MNITAIPGWNTMGVLPPIDTEFPTSVERSPYSVALLDVVMRFSNSPARRKILTGFLEYRNTLHTLGYHQGFQWLDGSFLEDVNTLERREPRDIDVVSFVRHPVECSPPPDLWASIGHNMAKARFYVDSYFVEMDEITPEEIVARSAYWYSMWSHRRNDAWKGFLQVDLAPVEDAKAKQWLMQFNITEVAV